MAKKKYMVVGRTKDAVLNGIQTSQGLKEFHGKTAMYVDQDMASEIETEHGLKGSGEVFTMEDDRVTTHVRDNEGEIQGVHHYHFGYSRTFAQNWEKIFGKARMRGDISPEVIDAIEKREEKRRKKYQ